jgi:hypothetical protein
MFDIIKDKYGEDFYQCLCDALKIDQQQPFYRKDTAGSQMQWIFFENDAASSDYGYMRPVTRTMYLNLYCVTNDDDFSETVETIVHEAVHCIQPRAMLTFLESCKEAVSQELNNEMEAISAQFYYRYPDLLKHLCSEENSQGEIILDNNKKDILKIMLQFFITRKFVMRSYFEDATQEWLNKNLQIRTSDLEKQLATQEADAVKDLGMQILPLPEWLALQAANLLDNLPEAIKTNIIKIIKVQGADEIYEVAGNVRRDILLPVSRDRST